MFRQNMVTRTWAFCLHVAYSWETNAMRRDQLGLKSHRRRPDNLKIIVL